MYTVSIILCTILHNIVVVDYNIGLAVVARSSPLPGHHHLRIHLCTHIQTSNTLAWALYCLATNPEVQEKLRSEVQAVVGSDKVVTPEHIAKMAYLHDCIRETQRYVAAYRCIRKGRRGHVSNMYCVIRMRPTCV